MDRVLDVITKARPKEDGLELVEKQDNALITNMQTDISSDEDIGGNQKDLILKKIHKILGKRKKTQDFLLQIRNKRKELMLRQQQRDGLKTMTYAKAKRLINDPVVSDEPPKKQLDLRAYYNSFRDQELATGLIRTKNWSGKNILKNPAAVRVAHLQKIFASLNNVDSDIWIKGW